MMPVPVEPSTTCSWHKSLSKKNPNFAPITRSKMAKKNALGRGLDALITFNESEASGSSSISEVELDKIMPNPDQPRRAFSEEGLNELAASIRSIGVIQPV